MGAAMAKNLHVYLQSQSSTSLRFYNRTASRGDALEALGGERCASVAELAAGSDVVFISASDDAAVKSIIEQIISSGPRLTGKIVVDTTTIHPNTTKGISEKLTGLGVYFAAMPVFGATPVAEQGKLLVAFAGSQHVYETIAPLLKGIIARDVLQVGEEPEKATLLKTTGQVVESTHHYIVQSGD
jgi:3-hydroxyisobutyrate dehydrogenase-like beta-hydroxyacid dehydrogenase